MEATFNLFSYQEAVDVLTKEKCVYIRSVNWPRNLYLAICFESKSVNSSLRGRWNTLTNEYISRISPHHPFGCGVEFIPSEEDLSSKWEILDPSSVSLELKHFSVNQK
jgi:hypothetical protein